MTADFKTLLAAAKLPERTVAICLRGDLVAEFEDLDRRLQALQGKPSDSLEGNGQGDLLEQMDALQEQMRDAEYPFRFRALPRDRFRDLRLAHPVRTTEDGATHPEDVNFGFNRDTFFDALMHACLIDPVMTGDQWTELAGKLTDRQWSDLADTAWFLNRGEIDVPFSQIASQLRRSTASE